MGKITEVEAQINELLDEVTKLTFVIKRKVIDGESTVEPRARKAKIEAQAGKLREAADHAKSKAERAFALEVAESAEEIARVAVKFVEDMILRLKPPSKPGSAK